MTEPTKRNVLIVDTGNYNRSPLIEVTLKALLEKEKIHHVAVESAGTQAEELKSHGLEGDERTHEVLKQKAENLHREFKKTHVDDAVNGVARQVKR